ncbi:sphingomyelin phosphodiesterase [Patulibacter defluvii]|uniref:sphingomyelin phosphodiesterase n=1 Tax=Patulibacter defluvii TaxID=3095358 RepID=UPI002A74AF35|nr:sphingomyelin phosphodiesterase [Patulibacter sp. DM4]
MIQNTRAFENRVRLAGALVLLLLAFAGSPFATRASASSDVSVLTFNLYQLPWVADTNTAGKQQRADHAAALIRRENADVVVLEEAFSAQAETMRTSLRTEYPHQTPLLGQSCSASAGWTAVSGNCSNSPVVVNGGVTILSKRPITASYQHVFNASQRWTADYYANKGVALVRIDTGDGPLWIAGTHLQADTTASARPEAHRVRMNQLGEIATLVGARTGGDPVVLAGDLNVEYYAGATRLDGAGRNEIQQAQVRSGFTVGDPSAYGYSYDGVTNPLVAAQGYASYRDTLDYVGVRTGGSASLSPVTLVGFAAGAVASDHYPVRATVTVP